jgi:hypothetical protein
VPLRNLSLTLLAAALLVCAGCSKDIQNKDAVKAGLMKHLTNVAGLDVNSMDIDIGAVSFQKDEATASVSFRPKGSSGGPAMMQMTYVLERKGAEWTVKGKRGQPNQAPHGAEGAPPMGGPGGGTPAMPPGHPPMNPPAPDAKK